MYRIEGVSSDQLTEVYVIFLISTQKHKLWVLVRTASSSTHNICFLTSTHDICFEHKTYEIYQKFLSEIFHFLVVKFSLYLKRSVFVMFVRIW